MAGEEFDYRKFWQLLNSLNEPFWSKKEKEDLKTVLEKIASLLPEFREVKKDNDFLKNVRRQCPAIFLHKDPLQSVPLPSEIEEKFGEYYQRLSTSPIVFLSKGRRQLEASPQIYLILRKNGLAGEKGEISRPKKRGRLKKAEEEIKEFLEKRQRARELGERITEALAEGRLPLFMFKKEFFGDERLAGIIDQVVEEVIQNPQIFPRETVEEIIKTYLENSSLFKNLSRKNQDEILGRAAQLILKEIALFQTRKDQEKINSVVLEEENGNLKLTIIPGGGSTERGSITFKSSPVIPRTIITRVLKTINKPETIRETEKIKETLESISSDPIRALFYIPINLVKNVIPRKAKEPLEGVFKKWKIWKTRYAISTSADAQREYMESLIKGVVKSTLKPFGVFDEEGHFFLISAIALVKNELTTRAGEKLANFFSRRGSLGKKVGKIFRKRLGKERNKEAGIILSIIKIIFDLITTPLAFLAKKIGFFLAKKIPFFSKITEKIANFRYSLESKFPLFKYLRVGTGIAKGIFKALPGAIFTAGIAYFATSNLPAAIAFGFIDLFSNSLRNLAKIPELYKWAAGTHSSFFGKLFGKLMTSRWFYVPLKLPLLSWFITNNVLPFFGVNLPFWSKFLISTGSGLLEYALEVGIPNLLKYLKVNINLGLGSFFSKLFFGWPGGLLLSNILKQLGITSLVSYGLGFPVGVFLTNFLFFKTFGPYSLGGWLSYLGFDFLAGKLGLTGVWHALFNFSGYIFGCWLTKVGISAIGSWLTSLGLPSLSAILAGVVEGLAIGGVIVLAVGIIIVLGYITITSIASTFVKEKQIRSGIIHPSLLIYKEPTVFLNMAKINTEKEVSSITYKISYIYKPNDRVPPKLDIDEIEIIDRFNVPFSSFEIKFYGDNNLGKICPAKLPASDEEGAEIKWSSRDCAFLIPLPNQTYTLSFSLVLKGNWDEEIGKENNICNILYIRAKTVAPEEKEFFSSLPRICINKQGEIVSGWNIAWPIDSETITSCFNEPRGSVYHKGIDIGTGGMNPPERKVFAIDEGAIVFSGGSNNGPYGYFIDIKHKNGWTSRYAHLDPSKMPPVGKEVKKGEEIGLSDNSGKSTGPHLHLEIFRCTMADESNATSDCWVDPLCFYPLQWQKSGCPSPNICRLK